MREALCRMDDRVDRAVDDFDRAREALEAFDEGEVKQ